MDLSLINDIKITEEENGREDCPSRRRRRNHVLILLYYVVAAKRREEERGNTRHFSCAPFAPLAGNQKIEVLLFVCNR